MTSIRQMVLHGARQTRRSGFHLGRGLAQPLVIALNGAMGAGKTVFAQGLARGLEVPADYYVTSPTYTLVHEYPGRLPFVHADFYRLTDPDEIDAIGIDDLIGGGGVVAIEWARKIDDILPVDYLAIDFEILSDRKRPLTWRANGPVSAAAVNACCDSGPTGCSPPRRDSPGWYSLHGCGASADPQIIGDARMTPRGR